MALLVANFETLERALELTAAVRPVIELVERRDRNLADQIKRASASIPLNLSEGAQRTGKDRENHYRIAAGSAAELQTAIIIGIGWGYVSEKTAMLALQLVSRVRAMTWRLMHPSTKLEPPNRVT